MSYDVALWRGDLSTVDKQSVMQVFDRDDAEGARLREDFLSGPTGRARLLGADDDWSVQGAALVLHLSTHGDVERRLAAIVDHAHERGLNVYDLSGEDFYTPYPDGSTYGDRLDVTTLDIDALYRAFLRKNLAPRLRQVGFRGSGEVFRLRPGGQGWLGATHALVAFQKSWEEGECQLFQIHASSFTEGEWRSAQNEFPHLAKAKPSGRMIFPGIGHYADLASPDGGYRWGVCFGDDLDQLAEEVLARMEEHLKPFFEEVRQAEPPQHHQ